MTASFISFETARLSVSNWNQYNKNLNSDVLAITSNKVMATLPPSWQNLDNLEKIQHWINEREQEGACFCIVNKSQDRLLIGLLFLYIDQSLKEIRLGYLLGEKFWGQKYASEVIEGLCTYCNEHFSGFKLIGGVETNNVASIKVLNKNGFKQQGDTINDTLFLERLF